MRRFVSQVRELCAGAAFALAGFSSGRGDCARGGCSARRCVPVGMFCARSRPPCGSIAVFCARSRLPCGSVGMSCACLTPAVRFYRGVLRSITPAVRFCRGVLRPITPAVRFYRGVLRSITPAVRFCWNVLRSPHACRAFLLECSALDHACCLTLSAKQDGLRYLAFLFRRGSESPLVRSHDFARLSDSVGSLRVCAFLIGDSDGVPEEVQEAIGKPPGERTSLEQKSYPCAVTRDADAVRRNRVASPSCSSGIVTAHSRRHRGEYAGAPRPRLRQRVFDSLDSLHAAAGLRWCVYAPPSLGYTERLARVRFMLGQVGLYSDDTYKLKRPDSSRPAAAAKSRVDTREAERPPALPAYFSIAALRLVISRMIFGSNFARRS